MPPGIVPQSSQQHHIHCLSNYYNYECYYCYLHVLFFFTMCSTADITRVIKDISTRCSYKKFKQLLKTFLFGSWLMLAQCACSLICTIEIFLLTYLKSDKRTNKCISRLPRHIPHHTALSNATAPNSECPWSVAAGANG